jgi:predicted dehydrogenase
MLKAAVIGVGSMGRNHARVYSELAGASLVAVADASAQNAQTAARLFGGTAYTDFDEMLAKEQPDVVTVAVPTSLHYAVTSAALQAGAHVLVEKPIAATPDEGQALIDLAARLNRMLMVGHIVRFNPAIQALKAHLDAGELGRVFEVVCRRVGPFPARIRDVGVVVDLAPHDLDLMRFLTGTDPVRLFAESEQRVHTAHEDLLLGLLRFPDGVSGALEINWLTPTKVREVTVLGERGMFRVDDLTQDLYFYENSLVEGGAWTSLETLRGVSEGKMVRFPLQRYEPLKAELQAFLDAVAGGLPAPVSGADGLQALRLALALVQSADTHQVIELERVDA